MKALRLYAGPAARQHLVRQGLSPADVSCIPAAAGGPKGLMLGRLDRFLFTEWLPRSNQPIDLVGASIGAWRMATACLTDSGAAFARLEHDYIAQHYELAPGEKRPPAHRVSEQFADNLKRFYGGRLTEVLHHPRYRLHIITSRGRHMLAHPGNVRMPVGYAGAFVSNAVHRKALGAWLQRVVFSNPVAASGVASAQAQPLPFTTDDLSTRHVVLTQANFMAALQASCSIPFVLSPVVGIPGAPFGCYWDGGITDYHLHMRYATPAGRQPGLVLYPHFQQAVVPGWLDKALAWRHPATAALSHMLVLAPNPEWVATLPNGKLPDRTDFTRYSRDFDTRSRLWHAAVAASQQLADEFAQWLDNPDMGQVFDL